MFKVGIAIAIGIIRSAAIGFDPDSDPDTE